MQRNGELLTGEDFLGSLDDGREVWIDGERVGSVVEHPAFRNSARTIARLYDMMHEPETRDVLTMDDRSGIRTHKFFAPSYSADELSGARDAIAAWQRATYGWMGRTPEYKAAFMAQLAEGWAYYGEYGDNARAWYEKSARKCLYMNHVLIDPPVDRHQARVDVRDVFVSVTSEDDNGIRVTGAKMVATGSAFTHATFVAVNSGTAARMEVGRDEDMALVFITDMSTPGVKLICRPSYEQAARSPWDAPLASRYDENDAVVVFDDAFIPWENVLVYRDVERAKGFYAESGFFNRFNLQSTTRLAVKLEFAIGLLLEGTRASGTSDFRGVQAAIGEVVAIRDTLWGMTTAMVSDPEPNIGGTVVPRLQTAAAARLYATSAWTRVRDVFESILAGAPIYTVSGPADLQNDELRPTIDQYFRGSGMPADQRLKLFKLIWDAVFSEFAGRHALYERNYAGNQEQQRLDTLRWAELRGDADRYREMVNDCMADYDLDGWIAGSPLR
ncbi:MAG: 4-hydroxyphenylacetate 3-hydroxylase family protein [Actinomycetota bacterium]|nr:4-hydroxyphenylacetate 3-hydroxylase family protein [Actinomycetota bacterium]